MMNQLTYNNRLEWIIRVGSLLVVVGIHLWLLFFNPMHWQWQSHSHSSSASMSNSLSLSFSSSAPIHSFPPKRLNRDEAAEQVSDRKIEKKIKPKSVSKPLSKPVLKQKPLPQVEMVSEPIEVESEENNEKENKESKEKYTVPNEAEIGDIAVADIEENDLKASDPKTSDIKTSDIKTSDIKTSDIKTSDIKNKHVKTQKSTKFIVYKPSLSAPPVPPIYPNVARKKKQQGTVWLDVSLDVLGRQQELTVHKSSGVALLDKAAIKAVTQWKFADIQQNHQASHVKIRIPIEFLLN
ncbi:MAG: energy transducer TonB [Cellvibrionaceae bacterium]